MRTLLACATILSVLPAALAQPAVHLPVAPERLLPANSLAYFRYDGYEPHRKAYDQTAIAKVMKEGLSEFFEHVLEGVGRLAEQNGELENPAKGLALKSVLDDFFDCLSRHGFAAALEISPPRTSKHDEVFQLTVVFPHGGGKKNRQALEKLFRLTFERLGGSVKKTDCGGRPGHSASLPNIDPSFQAAWWAEGEHLLFTIGTEPIHRARRVVEGQLPNLTSLAWFTELANFKGYETDMRGRVDLQAIVDHLATLGLESPGFSNIKDHLARQVVLRHLGLTGLKDLSFHLGFDGKYQRSTVRLGVVESARRTGLLKLLSAPPVFDSESLSPDKLPPLPPDADLVSVRHVNWENIYDFIRISSNLLALSNLLEDGGSPGGIPDLDRLLGLNFRKDFLEQLGTTTVTWGGHSEGPFFLGQGLAIKVKDAGKVRKSLLAISAALSKDNEMLSAEKQTYRGQEMYVFSKGYLPVSFAVHKDWLVFGLFPQPVQGVLLRSGGKYKVWKAPPEFDESLAKERKNPARGKLLGLSVSDPRPAVTIGLSLLPSAAAFFNLARSGEKVFDVSKIPNSQTINEWLFPNTAFLYDDGNALRWENHYSMDEPDGLMLLIISALEGPTLDLTPYLPGGKIGKAMPADPKELVPQGPDAIAELKQPTLCPAIAVEKDGAVVIQVTITQVQFAEVSKVFTETVMVKTIDKDGQVKQTPKTINKTVKITEPRNISQDVKLIADGKQVRVSRKDGKPVNAKALPKLLELKTEVLVVPGEKIDPEELKKIDEKTLILRVLPTVAEPIPIGAPKKKMPISPPAEAPKLPSMCAATALEKDGQVYIRLMSIVKVPFTAYFNVKEIKYKTVIAPDGSASRVPYEVATVLAETGYRECSRTRVLVVDGTKVYVTSRDGKTVDRSDLAKLLGKETKVLLVQDGKMEPADLRKLDAATLIVWETQ